MVRDVERGPGSEEGGFLVERLSAGWQAQDLVLDPWSGLAHKAIVGPGSRIKAPSLAPTWVGKHARRLNAYRLLAAYLANVARAFLPTGRDFEEILAFREYGDPSTLRDMIRASVLGDETGVVVDDAGDEPEKPTEPEPPGDDATPEAKANYAEEKKKFDEDTQQYEQDLATFKGAHDLQEWFDKWVEKEKFPLKLVDVENDAVGLGDGVYYVAWSNRKKRVCLHSYDPGFYFPVLETAEYDDFPERVHLAWQEIDDNAVAWVYRTTFELVDLPDGQTIKYPYADEDDDPSTQQCLMTRARWRFDDLGDKLVDQFDLAHAEIEQNADGEDLFEFPLGIDFIPIVHVPNTVSLKHHFGESAITRVAQIFDDIGQNDTDLAISADLAGAPPLSVDGVAKPADGKLTSYGPGTVFFGKVEVVDTSHALDALLKREDSLYDRLAVNGRVPKEVLGRIKMKEVPSGVALLLAFGPFRALINELRMVRKDKYALLFRMVQRLAMVGNNGSSEPKVGSTLKPGPTRNVEISFGSYLPTDVAQTVTMIVALLNAHGVSRASALRVITEAGVDIDPDLALELERIEHEDFEGGLNIANATGEEAAAAKYLGIQIEARPAVTAAPGPALGLDGQPVQPAPPPAPVPPGVPPVPPRPPGAPGGPAPAQR